MLDHIGLIISRFQIRLCTQDLWLITEGIENTLRAFDDMCGKERAEASAPTQLDKTSQYHRNV
jgi:hypothetical protein